MKITKGLLKKIIGYVLGIAIVAGASVSLAVGIKNACHTEKDIEQTMPDEDKDLGGSMEISAGESNCGISLTAMDMDDVEGIAENSQRITAVITPNEATNKVLDWTVEWKDASSTWANGKAVSDYIIVTPTSDGAMTADVTCKKAFAEAVIIKATVRDDSDIYGTCNVDYARKVIGTNMNLNLNSSSNVGSGEWNLTYTNTNVTVAFPVFTTSVLNDAQGWAFGAGNNSAASGGSYSRPSELTLTDIKNDVYTVDNLSSLTTKAYVSASTAYLNAMTTAGYTLKASANTYYELVYSSKGTTHISFAEILYDNFRESTSGQYCPTSSKWNNFRNALANNASAATINLKLETLQDSTVVNTTVYTIKFTTASLAVRAASVSFSSGITF